MLRTSVMPSAQPTATKDFNAAVGMQRQMNPGGSGWAGNPLLRRTMQAHLATAQSA